MTPRRLLTVGHSYAVALNRWLAHELQCVGAGRWDLTVAAPRFVRGNLRDIPHLAKRYPPFNGVEPYALHRAALR